MRRRVGECTWHIHVFFLVLECLGVVCSRGNGPSDTRALFCIRYAGIRLPYTPSLLVIRVRAACPGSGSTRSKRRADASLPRATVHRYLLSLVSPVSPFSCRDPEFRTGRVGVRACPPPHATVQLVQARHLSPLSHRTSPAPRRWTIAIPTLRVAGRAFFCGDRSTTSAFISRRQPISATGSLGTHAPQSSACSAHSACAAAVRGPAPSHSGPRWGSWGSVRSDARRHWAHWAAWQPRRGLTDLTGFRKARGDGSGGGGGGVDRKASGSERPLAPPNLTVRSASTPALSA